MRSFVWKAVLGAAFAASALSVTTRAQNIDNDGCSNRTLRGDYAFTVSGQIFLPTGAVVQRLGIAMTHFDGKGGLTQVDLVLSNPGAPPPSGTAPTENGFNINETGTYEVNSDCTGTFTIQFPDQTTAAGTMVKGATITTQFVLSDGGRSIHTVVTSLTPPGAPKAVPALITSEGHKLGHINEN